MQRLLHFAKAYSLVTIVLVVIALAGGLQLSGHHELNAWLLSATALLVAVKLGFEMLQTLREGRYGIDILAVTAIVSTVVVGEYWAAIVIVLMLTGGEALEDYAAARAKRELNALLERAPKTAHLVMKDGTKTIPLAEIKVDDVLLVKPGEVVPTDGILQDAAAEFDESSLTGESLPVEHKAGDELLSGSINGSGAVTLKVTKTAEESQYQQIIQLVQAATGSEAPFVRLADRYAVPFTIVSFAIAGLAWALSGEALRFAQVLVVATPCPLLLGAPIAFISGMSRAAKHGIIIKSGGILERLATVKAVAFDKTGTLTYGTPAVDAVQTAKDFTKTDVLLYAASAEQQSTHVLAQAIVSASQEQKIKLIKPTNVQEATAQGITATIHGKTVLVGKSSFLIDTGIKLTKDNVRTGETAAYVAVDGTYAGAIIFTDQVRDESKQTVKLLRTMGMKDIIMLTGDADGTAQRIAKAVGITSVKSECLPLDKVNAIKNAPSHPVMMVGDGVNDAPVLAVAEVGLAMGARGSTAASETADVVVLVDDISKSAQAIQIAKDTMSIAQQSIWIGIAISVGLMVVAATGVIPAVVGAGLQELVDVLVIFNALRAHGTWKKLV